MKAKGIVNEFCNDPTTKRSPFELYDVFEDHNNKLYNDKLKRLSNIATYAMNIVWYKYIKGELN